VTKVSGPFPTGMVTLTGDFSAAAALWGGFAFGLYHSTEDAETGSEDAQIEEERLRGLGSNCTFQIEGYAKEW
jgi:hypothetical protein